MEICLFIKKKILIANRKDNIPPRLYEELIKIEKQYSQCILYSSFIEMKMSGQIKYNTYV